MMSFLTILIGTATVFLILLATAFQAIAAEFSNRVAFYQKLAADRQGDSICTFARSLDYRRLDTKVIRAVYEALQGEIRAACPAFPVRASDEIPAIYRIAEEDLEDLICTLADQRGRSLVNYQNNPHYAETSTVDGLIGFLSAQPRLKTNC